MKLINKLLPYILIFIAGDLIGVYRVALALATAWDWVTL